MEKVKRKKEPKWDEEEAVMLYHIYFENGRTVNVPKPVLEELSALYNKKAEIDGIDRGETFRNLTGLKMQLRNIAHIVSDGQSKDGLSHVGQELIKAYDTYQKNPDRFYYIVNEFYKKYR